MRSPCIRSACDTGRPKALSDGAQTITPAVFADTIARCRQVAAALGRRMEDD
jgi:hypothetical protein